MLRRALYRPLALAGASVALAAGLNERHTRCAAAPEGLAAQIEPTVIVKHGYSQEQPLTLEYFCLRGLGELPRLLLEASGLSYSSVYHFGTGAYKRYAPFGQLPVLRDGDLLLTESGAIVRHLARKACLDGRDLAEKAKVDMYYELSKDISAKKSAIYDLQGHADAAKLKECLGYAEAACDGSHFVGNSLTLADVAMFHSLHFLSEVVPGSLSSYPKLNEFVTSFAKTPAIADYLASDRRVPLTHNELGNKPHAGLPGYKFIAPLKSGTFAKTWEGPVGE